VIQTRLYSYRLGRGINSGIQEKAIRLVTSIVRMQLFFEISKGQAEMGIGCDTIIKLIQLGKLSISLCLY
jgi:hypothetical protein